jgi:hypothetical protein
LNRWLYILLYLTTWAALLIAGTTPAATLPRPDLPPSTACVGNFEPPRDEISPAEEQALWEEIQRNLALLRGAGALAAPKAAQAVAYSFPLRLAPGLPDYAGFRVSAFADHHPASGQVLYHNGVYTATLADNTPGDGEYLWVPGLAIAPGPGYTIRVTSVLNSAVYDESKAPFTLLPTVFTHSVYLPIVLRYGETGNKLLQGFLPK